MEPADPADPSSRYALHAPLGQGAFGQVFRATQLATGRAVAVKVIALADGDAAELAEIEKEIAMMRNLPSEFVPELLEGAVWDGGVWIVMELMDGGSCADVLASHSRFSESAAAVVLRDVLRALKYLHGTGRIHRDIKGGFPVKPAFHSVRV